MFVPEMIVRQGATHARIFVFKTSWVRARTSLLAEPDRIRVRWMSKISMKMLNMLSLIKW